MKRSLLAALLILSLQLVHAQYYGNEWINYSQSYFRFKIINDGLYRISYNALINSGVPLSTINGSNLQIFTQGKEIPIYVTTGGTLGSSDYLEFYAVHNDGTWDSTLYADKNWQANNHLSLFNDTAAYFLTWSNQPSVNHFIPFINNISTHPSKESYCWYTSSYTYGGGP
jgi:hypothetical protein